MLSCLNNENKIQMRLNIKRHRQKLLQCLGNIDDSVLKSKIKLISNDIEKYNLNHNVKSNAELPSPKLEPATKVTNHKTRSTVQVKKFKPAIDTAAKNLEVLTDIDIKKYNTKPCVTVNQLEPNIKEKLPLSNVEFKLEPIPIIEIEDSEPLPIIEIEEPEPIPIIEIKDPELIPIIEIEDPEPIPIIEIEDPEPPPFILKKLKEQLIEELYDSSEEDCFSVKNNENWNENCQSLNKSDVDENDSTIIEIEDFEPIPIIEIEDHEPIPIIEIKDPEPIPIIEIEDSEPIPIIEIEDPEPIPIIEIEDPEPPPFILKKLKEQLIEELYDSSEEDCFSVKNNENWNENCQSLNKSDVDENDSTIIEIEDFEPIPIIEIEDHEPIPIIEIKDPEPIPIIEIEDSEPIPIIEIEDSEPIPIIEIEDPEPPPFILKKLKEQLIEELFDSSSSSSEEDDNISVGNNEDWNEICQSLNKSDVDENDSSDSCRIEAIKNYAHQRLANKTNKEEYLHFSCNSGESVPDIKYPTTLSHTKKRMILANSQFTVKEIQAKSRKPESRSVLNAKERLRRLSLAQKLDNLRKLCNCLNSNKCKPSISSILLAAKKECDMLKRFENQFLEEKKALCRSNKILRDRIAIIKQERLRQE